MSFDLISGKKNNLYVISDATQLFKSWIPRYSFIFTVIIMVAFTNRVTTTMACFRLQRLDLARH